MANVSNRRLPKLWKYWFSTTFFKTYLACAYVYRWINSPPNWAIVGRLFGYQAISWSRCCHEVNWTFGTQSRKKQKVCIFHSAKCIRKCHLQNVGSVTKSESPATSDSTKFLVHMMQIRAFLWRLLPTFLHENQKGKRFRTVRDIWPIEGPMHKSFDDGCENEINVSQDDSEGILPKGPYLPCVSMTGRPLLAGHPRIIRCVNSGWTENSWSDNFGFK